MDHKPVSFLSIELGVCRLIYDESFWGLDLANWYTPEHPLCKRKDPGPARYIRWETIWILFTRCLQVYGELVDIVYTTDLCISLLDGDRYISTVFRKRPTNRVWLDISLA